jgi:hypothetical protein
VVCGLPLLLLHDGGAVVAEVGRSKSLGTVAVAVCGQLLVADAHPLDP